MDFRELPLGFAMALAMNEPAMQRFEALSPGEKEAFLQRTRSVDSKREMQRLVASLADSTGGAMQ